LSQKKDNWAYEREWRVLGPLNEAAYSKKGTVWKIFLGAKIRPAHRQRLLAEFGRTKIQIRQMRVRDMGIAGGR
jgi:hypothetical protein